MVPDEVKASGSPREEPGAPRIPGYRLEGIVGRGATGVVYRARQLSVDRVVALKVLHKELVGTKSAALRLQREARTTARLAHPNIISAIDMGEVDGVWWYAMELVAGVSLLERLREKPLSEREALRMFIPLCDALQHAFQRGVVHRDIKPANILVEKSDRALLVDLGLAVADDDPFLTKGGGTLGTPHYISPDQARDPSGADVQADIWSLGATMYHAVCGRPPFSGDSVAEILSAVLYARVPDPSEHAPQLSSGFVLVLRKCLTRDRARRYSTPAELMADLERVRERRQPEVKRSALDPVARRTRPWWKAAAAAAIAIVGMTGIWMIVHRGDDASPQPSADAQGPRLDPIAELATAADGDASGLSRALANANALERARLSPEESQRVADSKRKIRQRMESEIAAFERGAESQIEIATRERRFEAARDLAAGLRKDLARRIGSEPLPERTDREIDQWIGEQAELARGARESAEAAYSAALERQCRDKVVPEVDRLQSEGRWRDAQLLLATDFAAESAGEVWGDDARISRAGLSSAAIESAVSLAKKSLEPRREALEKAWKSLDLDLSKWVAARIDEWKRKLESRVVFDASEGFADEWSAELARRNLTIEEMPVGWLNLSREEVVKGERELASLAKKLADDDARISFARLEDEAADVWRQRRYSEAARMYEQPTGEPWRETVRAEMDLRASEARLLASYLARAAAGLVANDGKNLELRAGTILLSGTVSAGADPLANGFQLTLGGGKVRALALRAVASIDTAAASSAPALVAAESIEALAALAPERASSSAADENLARALLRFREGDPYGAQAALNAGPLTKGPLLRDLETRVAAFLAQQRSSEGEDRARELEKLYLLRREFLSKGNRERARRTADELLATGSSALKPDEIADVRRMRDELSVESKPSTEQSIASFFRPSEISFSGLNKTRVHMTFNFDRLSAGAFDPGSWTGDGRSWSAAYAAKSDAEMFARAAPTLPLGTLGVQNDDVEVRLKIEQPADSKSDLLLVSLVGFHVVLVGASNARPARCYVDTLGAEQVVQAARDGAGKEFGGVKPGAAHELYLRVNRASGAASVELDGKRIPAEFKPRPRGDASTASLSIRSFEPVRLVQAIVDCARH
jgi:tRNA A-37 threonylcarbamoyl transferase component Bud32